jgi:hypothetical protein
VSIYSSCEIKKLIGFGCRFLLAKLYVDALMTKNNVADVQDALKILPSNLDDAYNDVMNRISLQSEDDRQLAWRTLCWVSNVKALMRIPQLRDALAVETNSDGM